MLLIVVKKKEQFNYKKIAFSDTHKFFIFSSKSKNYFNIMYVFHDHVITGSLGVIMNTNNNFLMKLRTKFGDLENHFLIKP